MKEIQDSTPRSTGEHSPLVETIAATAAVEPDAIRIQMGRRVVYGTLASGEMRRELDADREQVITAAIATQPNATEIAQYAGKLPSIEIKAEDTVVFRQERDGIVNVNTMVAKMQQTAIDQTSEEDQSYESVQEATDERESLAIIAKQSPKDLVWDRAVLERIAQMGSREKTELLLMVADDWVNLIPLAEPLARKTEIWGHIIETDGVMTTVSNPEQTLIRSIDPKRSAKPDAITVQAVEVVDQPAPAPVALPAEQAASGAIGVLKRQMAKLRDSETRQFCEKLAIDVDQQAKAAVKTLGKAALTNFGKGIAAAQIWLKREDVHAAVETVKDGVVQGIEQGTEQAGNWLTSRPEVIRDQNLAQSAYQLFQRGFERTGEKSYRQDDFQVQLAGVNQYTLSDEQGPLMKFKAVRSPLPGFPPRMAIVEKSDRLDREDYQAFRTFRRVRSIPQGSPAAEAKYHELSMRVAQTAREFLREAQITRWNPENGNYRMELQEDDKLVIEAKNG